MTASITIYGRHNCPQCGATVRKAEALGLPFSYVDLDDDIAAAARLLAQNHRSLPVVEAGDQVWSGFRPDLLDKVRMQDV